MIFTNFKQVLVIEDHFKGTGLFNSLCQYIIEEGLCDVRLHVLAPGDQFEARVGTKDYFSSLYGLSPEGIADKVSKILTSQT